MSIKSAKYQNIEKANIMMSTTKQKSFKNINDSIFRLSLRDSSKLDTKLWDDSEVVKIERVPASPDFRSPGARSSVKQIKKSGIKSQENTNRFYQTWHYPSTKSQIMKYNYNSPINQENNFISIDIRSDKQIQHRACTSNNNRNKDQYQCEGLFCEDKARKGIPIRRIGIHMHQLIQKCEFQDQHNDKIQWPKNKDFVQIDNEPNQINVEFLMNKSKNKFFFVSSKEHLKLKRPVTRYDFRGITHNKNNGLPKFKKKGKKIELLQSESDEDKNKKKTLFVCADCYLLYSDFYTYFKQRNERDSISH